MTDISWYKCSICFTKWYAFDANREEYVPCQGDYCKRRMKPYATRKKAFGHFQCIKCNKKWSSAHTYPNTFQKCKDCNAELLPYDMDPLQFSGEPKAGDSPHMESLCGKCIALGHRCCSYGEVTYSVYEESFIDDDEDAESSLDDDDSYLYDDEDHYTSDETVSDVNDVIEHFTHLNL